MKLHIDFPLQPWTNKLKCSDKLGFVGSCFSTEIGAQCKNIGIDTIINPFGTIFNPNSILELFSEKSIDKSDTIYDGKVYKYWHSTIHESTEQNQLIDDVNNTKDSFLQNLKSMKAIFITLGTNWVYRFVEQDKLVGNCHKIPQNSFKKELLSFNKTTIILSQITERIQQINPSIQVIYTLSPVRHIKDGIEENQYSKSTLRAAIGQICDSSPALYFPSYEIMMDELRDYRFYKEDLIHPSQTAVDYIFKKLINSLFTDNSVSTIQEVQQFRQFKMHKAKDQKLHQQQIEQKEKKLLEKHPYLNL